jgi:hypothetical protein
VTRQQKIVDARRQATWAMQRFVPSRREFLRDLFDGVVSFWGVIHGRRPHTNFVIWPLGTTDCAGDCGNGPKQAFYPYLGLCSKTKSYRCGKKLAVF